MAEDTTQQGGASDELTTPEEHTEASEALEPGRDVSDPGVPDDVEVAARSADMDAPSTTHEKVFVAGPGIADVKGNPWTEANGFDHEPNKAATRQYMIDHGLWPTSDVSFKSAKKHSDGVSWVLTYTVEAIPANDAPDGSQSPAVVAADGDASGARNYAPPSDVDEHADETTD